jgi:hypothetical protein
LKIFQSIIPFPPHICSKKLDLLQWTFHRRKSSFDLNHSIVFVDMNNAPKKWNGWLWCHMRKIRLERISSHTQSTSKIFILSFTELTFLDENCYCVFETQFSWKIVIFRITSQFNQPLYSERCSQNWVTILKLWILW